MRVTIVGAGPAGTHFASALKQQTPSADVTILEKGPEDKQNGLGYVVQQSILQELYALDKNVTDTLIPRATDIWDSVKIEAKSQLLKIQFPPSIGIRRNNLLKYMRGFAQGIGVEIKYDMRLSAEDIETLRSSSDLLVGADGINSVVRETYREEFGAFTVDGSNSFAWLDAQTSNEIMHVVLTEYEGITYVVTTYPIDTNSECAIIECSTEKLSQRRKNGSELERLSNSISTPFTRIILPQQELKWYESALNSCQQTAHENVVLIGESAVSTHYSLGAGLLLAFRSGKNLADNVQGSNNIKAAGQAHNEQIINWLKKGQDGSLKSMKWLEQVDRHYHFLGPEALIDAFRFKAV